MQEEKKITYTERGGVIKDESGKITHTVFPYKIEGIPMIGEPKILTKEEILKKYISIEQDKPKENWYKESNILKAMEEYSTQSKALITDAEIQKMVHENFKGLTDAMGGDEDLSYHYKGVIFECIKEASQSLKGNVFSEEDLRKAMLHASYETLNNKGIISHRDIDEYIQSLTKPTSAVFTDGEFSHFNY